ncbi:MAG: fructose-bisphosphate aldolase [Methanocalculus sp. MSAO_Arc1]|uniref:2-amino-3,7-dideoxy-D-threo-hept-6-ulosonate synthase n=1 Tax=Methanocalculus TaxID=71151 RepID=UPI000FF464A1|nr:MULTISPECIES: 2-amino-3,7-dideoxy-D-threo-hept-6-ulosonate synthase [unclassified Methanocalculus]MCP1661735.1 fructose-bisphosphate aldolase/2-amino-3,7-dideoxy-D-threo-hept-6-ulosonate synthase [Methanocalculus sp. AMF5]RQD79392.1 MAG: fructose-bisphosphate aldolase [Methanocalculus sp. MSAO_Arc1]
MYGKDIRMERIMDRRSGKMIIVPLDHGVSQGPIPGLIDLCGTVDAVAEGGATAVLGHVGLALHGHRRSGEDIGLILHLSASTSLGPDPNNKVIVNSPTHALKMGADAVSVHVNIGADSEASMIHDLGRIAIECMEWGMPLLAMMYPRGRKIADENDVEYVKLAARVASELGADIVKTVYTGDPDSFREVTEGCSVPVVVAGGSKTDDAAMLDLIEGAMLGGAAGISIGRNVFQHPDPAAFLRAARMVLMEERSADEAREIVGIG